MSQAHPASRPSGSGSSDVVVADPLMDLRDIHLPEAVWEGPAAPGWWGIGIVVVFLTLWLARTWWRRRRSPNAEARFELRRIGERHARDGDSARALAEISKLLRRYVLSRYPAEQVAALHGPAWLACLDRIGGEDLFTAGPGQAIGKLRYLSPESVEAEAPDVAALLGQVERWLAQAGRAKPAQKPWERSDA